MTIIVYINHEILTKIVVINTENTIKFIGNKREEERKVIGRPIWMVRSKLIFS